MEIDPNNVSASTFSPNYATTGFECSMDGYKQLVMDVVDLTIFYIPLIKEITKSVLPEDLKKALDHTYKGIVGVNAWSGYLMAAIYYLGED